MEFINQCNCIVDYSALEKAIIEECSRRNITPNSCSRIYIYRGYAGISIKHDKVSVHRMLGKYMVGYDFPSNIVVHHSDGKKLNNKISNLQVMKSELHAKDHNIVQYVSADYMKGYGNRMKSIISRTDVKETEVIKLRKKGFTISEIAKELNCGYNTVCRRLGMKD